MRAPERLARRIDAIQQHHPASAFFVGVIKKFGDDNGGALTAQLTYSMFMTVFPLLLLLVTILGVVLANDASARQRVVDSAFGEFPIIGQQLAHNIHALKRSTPFGLVVGVLGLLYGSTGLAGTGLYAMAQVWNIPIADRPSYLARMGRSVTFLAVLGVGLILTTALSGFGTFGVHKMLLGIIGEVLACLLNVVLYFVAFRVLTPKQVSSRPLLPGAVVGGIAWTVLQAVGGYVVGHDLRGANAVYGLFGLVLGLIAWIYLGAEISLYSAEINVVLKDRLWPRALVQPPLTRADQESIARQVTENQRRPDQDVETTFQLRPMTEDEYRERGHVIGHSGEDLTKSIGNKSVSS